MESNSIDLCSVLYNTWFDKIVGAAWKQARQHAPARNRPGRGELLAVASVEARPTLIASLVLSGDPGHEMLGGRWIQGLGFSEEVLRGSAAQRGSEPTMVKQLDDTCLALAVSKPKVTGKTFVHGVGAF